MSISQTWYLKSIYRIKIRGHRANYGRKGSYTLQFLRQDVLGFKVPYYFQQKILHCNARTDNKHTTRVTIILILNKANQLNYLFINILPLVEVSLETRYNDL